MSRIIRFKGDDGSEVLVEVKEHAESGMEQAGLGAPVELAQKKFEEALAKLRPITDTVMRTLRDLNNPDECSIEFGITLNAEAGAIIASASAEANISVSLKWSKAK